MNPLLERQRALRQLSRMTVASAIVGIAGVAGFGGLAAATYRGTTTSPTEGAIDPTVTDGDQAPAPTSHPATGQRRTRQPTSVTPPRRSSGGGHVTSGGSG